MSDDYIHALEQVRDESYVWESQADHLYEANKRMKEQIEELEAENVKLKEALDRIAEEGKEKDMFGYHPNSYYIAVNVLKELKDE